MTMTPAQRRALAAWDTAVAAWWLFRTTDTFRADHYITARRAWDSARRHAGLDCNGSPALVAGGGVW